MDPTAFDLDTVPGVQDAIRAAAALHNLFADTTVASRQDQLQVRAVIRRLKHHQAKLLERDEGPDLFEDFGV